MPGNYTLRETYVDGDVLSAADYMADHQQHIDNQTPQGTDDYSANVTQMRTTVDTGDVNSESLATSLAGELERIRYALKHLKDTINGSAVLQWYDKSYSVVPANGSVTTAKLATSATFTQDLRNAASNTVLGLSDTVMASQIIPVTRARVRVMAAVNVTGLLASDGAKTVTIRVKRGATILASKVITLNDRPGTSGYTPEPSGACTIFYSDNPGPGTFTYTVTGAVVANLTCNVNEAEIMVQEVV